MEMRDGTPVLRAQTADEWRTWLAANAETAKSVWLVIYHASSATPSVGYQEAIELSLCYGWIDSQAIKRDTESFCLRFWPRNPKSTWSRVNRERAERMIAEGLMTPAGQAMIDLAKERGTWNPYPDAEELIIPDDLQQQLDRNETALRHFEAFPPSSKRLILAWIASAKKPETRLRRIAQTVEKAERNERVNQPKR